MAAEQVGEDGQCEQSPELTGREKGPRSRLAGVGRPRTGDSRHCEGGVLGGDRGTCWDAVGEVARPAAVQGVPQDVPPRVLTRAAQAPLPYEVRRKATTASAATALPCEQIKTIPVFFVCLFARSTKDTFFGMP